MAGCAYARLEFPGRDLLFFGLLTTTMIPGAVTFVPVFIIMRALGMLDTYRALILPHAAVARIAGAEIDYVTLHQHARADELTPPEDECLMTVSAPSRIHDLIVASRRAIDANAPAGKRIPISFDEWNVVHRRANSGKIAQRNVGHPALGYQAQMARLTGVGGSGRQNYALADGLYAAGFFNSAGRLGTRSSGRSRWRAAVEAMPVPTHAVAAPARTGPATGPAPRG